CLRSFLSCPSSFDRWHFCSHWHARDLAGMNGCSSPGSGHEDSAPCCWCCSPCSRESQAASSCSPSVHSSCSSPLSFMEAHRLSWPVVAFRCRTSPRPLAETREPRCLLSRCPLLPLRGAL